MLHFKKRMLFKNRWISYRMNKADKDTLKTAKPLTWHIKRGENYDPYFCVIHVLYFFLQYEGMFCSLSSKISKQVFMPVCEKQQN